MPERLLVRHFLRRFLENDLISPHADRHDMLATIAAGVLTSGLFVTVLLSLKYQFMLQPPGHTSVFALDDRFLYISCSMILMALAAVSQWDALALDVRDTSILGPLPIDRRTIVRAKLAAVGLFGLGCAAAINLAPALLHPWMLAGRLPVGLSGLLALTGAHAAVTVAAGAFGFLGVLAIREVLHAVVGTAWFTRVATVVQAALVVLLASSFLLVPGLSSGMARAWLIPGSIPPTWIPPLWFLGLHEVLAGQVIAGLPAMDLRGPLAVSEREAAALYRGLDPLFHQLAGLAIVALVVSTTLAVAAFAWNNRRLPVVAFRTRGRGQSLRRSLGAAVERLVVRTPAARAGFAFTLQCLSRSVPHRLAIAASVGVGLASAAVTLREVGVRGGLDEASIPVGLLAVQTMLVIVLLAGFRHAVRVPAELRANWNFHVSWSGDERPFLAGARRATLLVLIVPALLALAPLYAFVIGWPLAVAHAVCGFLLALALLRVLLLGFRKLPFASSYVPSINLKALSPVYVLFFLLVSYAVAGLERLAFTGTGGTAALLAALALLAAGVAQADRLQRQTREPIDLDEPPAPATQRLGLGG
jgi:hypothetical protein